MDNTEIETPQDPKNSVLLYTTVALAAVGAVVVVSKTILYTRAIITVAKQKKAEKQVLEILEPADPS